MNSFKVNAMKKALFPLLCAFLLLNSGCGTLFFSHRIGKKISKQRDNRVFIGNCILCLAGIVPGVVAFILDSDNGTLYYTEAEMIPDDFGDYKNEGACRMKQLPCHKADSREIAALLSQALGKEITPDEIKCAVMNRALVCR